jgi:pyruvate dehydrogenase E2 component (dihydrolipoamide acetyltransferase)
MSKRIDIRVPDIGDFTDVPVIEVLVAAGDRVAADDSLLTLESDKATMEVPSPAAGVIAELSVVVGDTVSEGDRVAVLEAEEDEAAQAAAPEQDDAEPGAAAAPEEPAAPASVTARKAAPATSAAAPATIDAGPRQSPPVTVGADANLPDRVPYASPVIRAFARELGVDLFRVSGSGRNGRILREDVTAFVKAVMAGAVVAPQAAMPFDLPEPPDIDFSKFGEIERQPLSRIKKISGKNLHRNWLSIPHVTQNDVADITAMEAFRQANKQAVAERGYKLTPLVFLIKACVAALREYPQFNASLDPDGEHLVLKKYFNIGIAVDTPDGLVVPAIRDCDSKGVLQLAQELGEVSQRARDKKLTPQDWQGACFTISSLGGIGGTSFNPIINAPEVAILGVSRARLEPVWNGEEFAPRLMLPLSLSYDHRVIDGAAAARFVRFLAQHLENEDRLTLD